MKFLVGVNTLTAVNSFVYSSHCNFWFWLGKTRPNDSFIFFTPPRMSIDRMRNEAAIAAMKNECDYLMFIDDDVILPKNALDLLIDERYDVTSGMTVIRGYPFDYMVFKYTDLEKTKLDFYNDFKVEDADDRGFVECDAVGFSCALIKVPLLLKLSPPFFLTGQYHTEDIYFCVKATKEYPETKLGFNTRCWTGHVGDNRVYTPTNRKLYKKFEEEETPELIPKNTIDRGTEYRDLCIKTLQS